MKDGSYKQTIDLNKGDSINITSKWGSTWSEIMGEKSNSKSQQYWMTNNGKSNIFEHKLIYEQLTGTKIPSGYVIHHKDFNGSNNSIDNLQLMSKQEHDALHDISGDNNPVRRFPECNWMNNPEIQKRVRDQHRVGKPLSDITKRRISKKINDLHKDEKFIKKMIDGIHSARIEKGTEWNKKMIDTRLKNREIKLKNLVDEFQLLTDLECFYDGHDIRVHKSCEECGAEFTPLFNRREQAYCSHACSIKNTTRKAAISNNKRAIEKKSILIEIGYDIFCKYTVENKQIPPRRSFEMLLNEHEINDIRTLGFFSYNDMVKYYCDRYNVKFESPKKWSNKHHKSIAEDLIENGMLWNHKIVSVNLVGKETVYNGTVDDVHNFDIIFSEEKTASGRPKFMMANNLQCGEQILPVGGVCLLGSLNLTQFVKEDLSGWDYDRLAEIIPIAVRMMDNVNDITYVPLQEQHDSLINKRRIGLGVLGYASALMMMKVRYGSKQAIKLTDDLMSFISNTAYSTSSDLAAEKGSFLKFDKDEYLKSEFIKVLKPETIEKIKKQGLRNSHLLSIQPTGNSSVFANNVSGGLEPLFMTEYVRTAIFPYPPEGLVLPKSIDFGNKTFVNEGTQDWMWVKEGDENLLVTSFGDYVWKVDKSRGLLRETVVKDYAVKVLEQTGEWDPDADWAATSMEISIEDHVNTMKSFSVFIDSAMSKTVNLPEDYKYEDFKNLYKEVYETGTIKGVTTYRAGTMTSVLASKDANMNKDVDLIPKTKAPKRPKELRCDIHNVMVEGKYWIVIIGLIGNDPYEVFAFPRTGVQIHNKFKSGKLIKVKSGVYNLVIGDDEIILENVASLFGTNEQEALSRMVSTALRHGADIGFIVEQLQKSQGTIVQFAKCLGRTLNKYISANSAVGKRTLDCDVCGGKQTLVMREGCFVCKNCGNSKCG
jgi:ribonucleotide reductase alpha subunit